MNKYPTEVNAVGMKLERGIVNQFLFIMTAICGYLPTRLHFSFYRYNLGMQALP